MKIAIYLSEIIWTPHMGTGLELIERQLIKGNEVVKFVCNSHHNICDQNITRDKLTCYKCIAKRKRGFSILNKSTKEIVINYSKQEYVSFPSSYTIEDIKNLKFENFDVGNAVVSSLVSLKRNAYLSIEEFYSEFKELINNAIGLYQFFKEKLKEEKPNIVYLFNGRLTYDRALMRAAESLDINFIVYERGSNIYKYGLYHNSMPHNLDYIKFRIFKAWNESEQTEINKLESAKFFFEKRRFGKIKNWLHFTRNQEIGKLPDGWDDNCNNVVVFLSSEDEFVAIGDQWKMILYRNQLDGLKKIAFDERIKVSKKLKVYVRIHPNSKGTSESYLTDIANLNSDQVIIIPPESKISTYALLMSCSKVVSFGSTVGIEASYWKKPSICLGVCFYKQLNVTHNPESHDVAIKMILDDSLPNVESENIFKYAYFFENRGIKYKFYEPERYDYGKFKGVEIHDLPKKYDFLPKLRKRIPWRLYMLLLKSRLKLHFKND